MEAQVTHCLWINEDTGEVNVAELSTPIERCALGFYVPHFRGTLAQMEERKRQIIQRRIAPPRRAKKAKRA